MTLSLCRAKKSRTTGRKNLLNKVLFYATLLSLLLFFISCRNVQQNECQYGRRIPSAMGSFFELIEVKDTNVIYNVLDTLFASNTSVLNKDAIVDMSINRLGDSYDTIFIQTNIKQKLHHISRTNYYLGGFQYKGYEIILSRKNSDEKLLNDYFNRTKEKITIFTLDFRIKNYFKEEAYKENKKLELGEFYFNFKIVNNKISEITTNYSNNISLKTREELENLYGK